MIRRFIFAACLLTGGALFATTAAPAGAAGNGISGGSGGLGISSSAERAFFSARRTVGRCFVDEVDQRVYQQENGRSGTNYFQQRVQGQVFRNGAWRVDATTSRRSGQFANDARNFFFHPNTFFYTHGEFNKPHRLVIRAQWWNNSGTPGFFGDDFTVHQVDFTVSCFP